MTVMIYMRNITHITNMTIKRDMQLMTDKTDLTYIIRQPLRTNKNLATSRDKKKCIISGQKNHATSQDKKNHTTSREKKEFMHPLGPKKSRNLLGQKNNHASSQDNKN